MATFYDFRTSFVIFCRKRIRATGIASDNTFKKPDAPWAKVKDMEEAKDCEYEERPRFAREKSRTTLQATFGCEGDV